MAKPAKDGPKQSYRVTSPIMGDDAYKAGDTISLTDAEAKELADIAAIDRDPLSSTAAKV